MLQSIKLNHKDAKFLIFDDSLMNIVKDFLEYNCVDERLTNPQTRSMGPFCVCVALSVCLSTKEIRFSHSSCFFFFVRPRSHLFQFKPNHSRYPDQSYGKKKRYPDQRTFPFILCISL